MPDYSQMSKKELREYLLKNRSDQAGWDEYFSRRDPNARSYSIDEFEAELKRRLSDRPSTEEGRNDS